jgi:hypothetical protein
MTRAHPMIRTAAMRAIPVAAIISLLPVASPATEAEPPSCAARIGRGARIGVPFIHIAILEIGMYVGASALWPDGYTPTRVAKNWHQFKSAWQAPPEYHFTANPFASDNDWWYFNFFAHGLFGAEAYLAARGLEHGPTASLGYALFASFTWEYLVEGFYKHPSAIDLFWTPAFGSLLGELRYRAYRLVSEKVSRRPVRIALQVLLDPLGKLQRVMLGCRD